MGSCCGVSAEVKAAAVAESGFLANVERVKSALGSWPSLVLAAVALAASFLLSEHGCGAHGATGWQSWRQAVDPAWIPLILCGLPILSEAVEALVVERKIRASLLISTAMVSCVAIGQLFAAGEVAFIMALGEKLEAFTAGRARKGLRRLVALVPQTARYVVTCPKCLAQGVRFKDLPLSEINVGDMVKVLPGETIPLDGVIAEGETTVDQSVMTGESLPIDKTVGDDVYSGTINRFGAIVVKVAKKGEDSSLQKLVRLVREAAAKKAPMQRIADKWAAILVPCSMTIALAAFFGVWSATGDVQTGLLRGVTVMVVFCPCALALATPTSVMAAIGQATKHGVIVKSGEALERMGTVTVACFDKTGTLTEGRLSVSDAVAFSGGRITTQTGAKENVLALAASVEASSEHPLAKAIVAAKRDTNSVAPCEEFSMKPGRGVKGNVGGASVVCGTAVWLSENGIAVPAEAEREADVRRSEGKAVVFVAAGGEVVGLVALADAPRKGARESIAELSAAGVEACLLTGDHEATARFVAKEIGIGDVRAELLPDAKAEEIEGIERSGRCTCMVGDGVNDAVALKTAHVGIAMGGEGSDIAVEAADIALVGDDLTKIAYLKRLSAACVRLIKTNIAISMTVNAIAITCSVLGLLGPVSGALVHNCGSALVVLNAALLYDRKFR